jgi:hypothetical protein
MNARLAGGLCALAIVGPMLGGCGLYLHDQVAASRAVAVKDAWSKVSADPVVKIELRNLDAVAQEQLKVVADQARVSLALALQQLPTKRWIAAQGQPESAAGPAVEDEVLFLMNRNFAEFGFATAAVATGQEQQAKLAAGFAAATQALKQASGALSQEEGRHPVEVAEVRLATAARASADTNAKDAYTKLQEALRGRDLKRIREAEAALTEKASDSSDAELQTRYAEYAVARKKAPAVRDLTEVVTELQAALGDLKKGNPLDLSAAKTLSAKTFKDGSANLQKLGSILSRLDTESQPGLKLVLLGFAVDVATAERDRLAVQLGYVEDTISLATRRRDRVARVVTDAAAILNYINGNLAYVHDQLLQSKMRPEDVEDLVGAPNPTAVCGAPSKDDTVLVTLRRWARRVQQSRASDIPIPPPPGCLDIDSALENEMLALLRYASLAGYQKYYERLERHEAAIAAHRVVRQEDSINTREREQLISRSLDGLALFYQGGITKDDVAKLAALVEGLTIAVGVNR